MELRELQLELVESMVEIDRICREHDITYYLSFGTLIGAVRHKGFIPWDDDLDIEMPRKDYEKFLEIFPKYCSDKYFLQTPKTDKGYPYLYAKVRTNNTKFVEHKLRTIDMHHGVFVDIFPLEDSNGPYDKKSELQYQLIFAVTGALMLKSKADFVFERKAKPVIQLLSKMPKKFIIYLGDLVLKHYKNKDYYFPMTSPNDVTEGIVAKKELFSEKIELEFEGHLFYAPIGYHEILTQTYGDYMTPPKKEDQVSLHEAEY